MLPSSTGRTPLCIIMLSGVPIPETSVSPDIPAPAKDYTSRILASSTAWEPWIKGNIHHNL